MAEPVIHIVTCPYCGAKAKARDVDQVKSKLKSHIQNKHPEKAV